MRLSLCLLVSLALPCAMTAQAADCRVDRGAAFSQSPQRFDQDTTNGWRALAGRPGCEAAAANLIADYRTLPHARQTPALAWEEAQLRARGGQTEEAVALMQQTYRMADRDETGWNLYVDATIAFLRNDRTTLERSRQALSGLAPPPGMPLGANGQVALDPTLAAQSTVSWPPRLGEVDGLRRCFGRTYRQVQESPDCGQQ